MYRDRCDAAGVPPELSEAQARQLAQVMRQYPLRARRGVAQGARPARERETA